ncbi:hypothetical protein ONZ45_g8927 [Pleurotus djamor]|nr:hypothetical protein ONZ45_g8927 [Pleurotus djamor]
MTGMSADVAFDSSQFGLLRIAKLPIELWANVIASDDSHDRRSLLALQGASKQLYALVTPLIYDTISIMYSGSDDFVKWAETHGAEHFHGIETIGQSFPFLAFVLRSKEGLNIVWETQNQYNTFPNIYIPFHRLSKLHATFSLNPSLATHTTSLILKPFQGKTTLKKGWKHVIEIGWAEIRELLPYFANVHRISVCCSAKFPSEILLSLPTPGQLTHLRILAAQNAEELVPVLKLHPNLQVIRIPFPGYSDIPSQFYDALIDLPRLTSLEPGPTLWVFLSRQLSASSLSALRHFSLNTVPAPLPPVPTLNNLLSFQITYERPSIVKQAIPHLRSIEYISIMASTSDEITDIADLFSIPSPSLKYIYIQSFHPASAFQTPPLSALFERFPELPVGPNGSASEKSGAVLVVVGESE